MTLFLTFYGNPSFTWIRFEHVAEGDAARRILGELESIKGDTVRPGEVVCNCRVWWEQEPEERGETDGMPW